jgi:hypothetical protein
MRNCCRIADATSLPSKIAIERPKHRRKPASEQHTKRNEWREDKTVSTFSRRRRLLRRVAQPAPEPLCVCKFAY